MHAALYLFVLVQEEIDVTKMEHPHAAFMERAIYLSRVAGLEKRTGVQLHRLVSPGLLPSDYLC